MTAAFGELARGPLWAAGRPSSGRPERETAFAGRTVAASASLVSNGTRGPVVHGYERFDSSTALRRRFVWSAGPAAGVDLRNRFSANDRRAQRGRPSARTRFRQLKLAVNCARDRNDDALFERHSSGARTLHYSSCGAALCVCRSQILCGRHVIANESNARIRKTALCSLIRSLLQSVGTR